MTATDAHVFPNASELATSGLHGEGEREKEHMVPNGSKLTHPSVFGSVHTLGDSGSVHTLGASGSVHTLGASGSVHTLGASGSVHINEYIYCSVKLSYGIVPYGAVLNNICMGGRMDGWDGTE